MALAFVAEAEVFAVEASNRLETNLVLVTPATYLPGLPVLLRVELRDGTGVPIRSVWDATATLEVATAGVSLSTNRVELRNGMGSSLVTFTGGGDVTVRVVSQGSSVEQTWRALDPNPTLTTGGTLTGSATTWAGVVRVTNDVVVPSGHVLTIEPGTWVLFNGVASGTAGVDLQVSGSVQSRGTPALPVVLTCASPGLRWGQIRHDNAEATYRNTIVTLAGRGVGEGHTGQTPVIRSSGSRLIFDGCSLTDHASPAGTPGKIMQSSGSDLVMTNCLLARARMGPEIGNTSLQFLDSYIIDMRGPDDADGIYLHSQAANQVIRLAGSVVAGGDDDGIDTLGARITVEDCIVRGWRYPGDDSKGISVFGGECRVWRCLLADNTIGLSGKANNGESVLVLIDRSTILGNSYGVAVTNKSGTTPEVDYGITNSIILAPDPIFTDYNPADIHISYSLAGEAWPGMGNLTGAAGFVDAAKLDFRLAPYSQCIDAGDPGRERDVDGTVLDIGYLPFITPAPVLADPLVASGGVFSFVLKAYPHRRYQVESSVDAATWVPGQEVRPTTGETLIRADEPLVGERFYRARLAP
jgi:hypothetical protein